MGKGTITLTLVILSVLIRNYIWCYQLRTEEVSNSSIVRDGYIATAYFWIYWTEGTRCSGWVSWLIYQNKYLMTSIQEQADSWWRGSDASECTHNQYLSIWSQKLDNMCKGTSTLPMVQGKKEVLMDLPIIQRKKEVLMDLPIIQRKKEVLMDLLIIQEKIPAPSGQWMWTHCVWVTNQTNQTTNHTRWEYIKWCIWW